MAKKHAKQAKQETSAPSMAAKGTYPYYLLKTALRVGQLVADHGGDRVNVPKSVIAEGLDMDQGSSNFAQMVASAKSYGMVEGHTELKLSDLGRDYFSPTSEGAQRLAELGFFMQPPVFRHLIEQFDGSRLPPPLMLTNILGRQFRINDSWRGRVAQIFVSTATDLGVLDQSGFLRYDATRHRTETGGAAMPQAIVQDEQTETTPSLIETLNQAARVDNGIVRPVTSRTSDLIDAASTATVWRSGDPNTGVVRVETPANLTWALWDRLQKYVDILQPEKPKEG